MLPAQQFEVFYDDPFELLLVGSFDEFAAAREAMVDFARHVPGRYFVWSSAGDEVLDQLYTGAPPIRA